MFLATITAEEYRRTFEQALGLLQVLGAALSLYDPHEIAHQATEAHFQNPALPLAAHIQKILGDDFSCNLEWAEVQPKIENPKAEDADDISRAETALDLFRLYLLVSAHLSDDERRLYQRVWSQEELTDAELLLLEDLGVTVRKVIDATRGPKKFSYVQARYRSQKQVFAWKTLHQKSRSAPPGVNQTRDEVIRWNH